MNPSTDPTVLLHGIFQEEWEAHLRNDPFFATVVGDSRFNALLPVPDEAEYERQAAELRSFLHRLEALDRDLLTPADRLNLDIFMRLKRDALTEIEFPTYRMPLTRLGGHHTLFAELSTFIAFEAEKDYEDYLTRLTGFAAYSEKQIELMRGGLRSGWTQPRIALEGVEDSISDFIVVEPPMSVYFAPFKSFPASVTGEARRRLQAEAELVISKHIVPAYRQLLQFVKDEYLPGVRTEIAASSLPDGRQFYEHRVRMNVSLDVTPDEVHQIGLKEVRRIREEMDAVRTKVGFDGDREQFGAFLRSDARFYVDTPEQLMKEVAYVLKRMDGELPRLFRTLPRQPFGIRPVPDYLAPRSTTAYYWEGAGDGSRPGCYYVNTYDLKSRPLYELEALSLHEAVPGHHLQIALQQEMTNLPEFRRFEGFTAFVEGWGLYAERLGLEVGFYTDPYSDYGRLTYEMWRACRLVVDTGMHAFGWTRERAIDFMAENTALTRLNVRNEIDRYIAWPGQALAYKMGELKIRELRRRAEQALGERFDVRSFHDVVLRDGAVPLDVLEKKVEAWIAGM